MMTTNAELFKRSWSWWNRFRWYRRRAGGYWTRSAALGWKTYPDWLADLDFSCSIERPDLYRNGRDVEDYRLHSGNESGVFAGGASELYGNPPTKSEAVNSDDVLDLIQGINDVC